MRGLATLPASDHSELTDLYGRYCRTIDCGDAQGWVDCFATDGVYLRIVGGETTETRGREALLPFAHSVIERRARNFLHVSANLEFEPDGAGALGACVMTVFDVSAPGAPSLSSIGVYEDRLVRQDGRWCFSWRTVVGR
jgi:hypothetical protein